MKAVSKLDESESVKLRIFLTHSKISLSEKVGHPNRWEGGLRISDRCVDVLTILLMKYGGSGSSEGQKCGSCCNWQN